jgi:hypothetical protein
MLPDGVSNDRVRQSGGRYALSTDFEFLMRMGLWCELRSSGVLYVDLQPHTDD